MYQRHNEHAKLKPNICDIKADLGNIHSWYNTSTLMLKFTVNFFPTCGGVYHVRKPLTNSSQVVKRQNLEVWRHPTGQK